MDTLIFDPIRRYADCSPDHTAIRCVDRQLSYAELDVYSNRLARVLVKQGVRRHARVGIYMDKCLETAVALYGIMKAGAAYVPLDPSAPEDRTAFVLHDCGIRHLIADRSMRRKLGSLITGGSEIDCLVGVSDGVDLPVVCVGWDEVLNEFGDTPPPVKIIEQDLAYVIYTSGSTGAPKGIMHTHHSGLSFAQWAASEYSLQREDCLSNHAPLHFDLSIFDFFAGAVAGATTSILPEEYLKLPPSYTKLLESQRISVLFTVPFALIQMDLYGALEERDLSALRWIIFGGEPFSIKHLRSLMGRLPGARFDNMYGPAEVNGCTHYTVDALEHDCPAIPIGRICDIAEALVVDGDYREVAPGEAGELLVRTPTMMQGYWGQAELNLRAFYQRDDIPGYRQVFYRTGDIVEQRKDGNFMFLGRKDRQVKIRGYRVELDEIEAAFSRVAQVEEAAAYAVPDADENHSIHVEVTLKEGVAVATKALLEHARSRLPWYAVPSRLSVRTEFPRTSTGKIDRRTLRLAAIDAQSLQVNE